MHGQHGLKWSHFLLLTFVFVLGIFVPLSWHRQHGRHPIEPLNPRLEQVTPSIGDTSAEQSSWSRWQLNLLAANNPSDEAAGLSGGYRRISSLADPPPHYQRPAWPTPHAILKKLDLLEQAENTRPWAQQVREQLDKLRHCKSLTDESTSNIFDGLQNAVDQAPLITSKIDRSSIAYQFNAACYDLKRRLAIWQSGQNLSNTFPQGIVNTNQPFLGESSLRHNLQSSEPTDFSIDVSDLLAALEQYEFSRLSSDAVKIANVIEPLLQSQNDAQRAPRQSNGSALPQRQSPNRCHR